MEAVKGRPKEELNRWERTLPKGCLCSVLSSRRLFIIPVRIIQLGVRLCGGGGNRVCLCGSVELCDEGECEKIYLVFGKEPYRNPCTPRVSVC